MLLLRTFENMVMVHVLDGCMWVVGGGGNNNNNLSQLAVDLSRRVSNQQLEVPRPAPKEERGLSVGTHGVVLIRHVKTMISLLPLRDASRPPRGSAVQNDVEFLSRVVVAQIGQLRALPGHSKPHTGGPEARFSTVWPRQLHEGVLRIFGAPIEEGRVDFRHL